MVGSGMANWNAARIQGTETEASGQISFTTKARRHRVSEREDWPQKSAKDLSADEVKNLLSKIKIPADVW